MSTFHAEPNRASPATHIWFSVETPSVFKEYRLPASNEDWNAVQWHQFHFLEEMAEKYETHIHRTSYRRG